MAHRVQMDLTDQSFERLKKLKKRVDAASSSEVMKEALRLYDYLTDMDINGARFFIEERGRTQMEVKLFATTPVPTTSAPV
jgi:hypothetical protein